MNSINALPLQLDIEEDEVCENCGSDKFVVSMFWKSYGFGSTGNRWFAGEDEYGSNHVLCAECGDTRLISKEEFIENQREEKEDYDEFFKKYQPITVPNPYADGSLNNEYENDISWSCIKTPSEFLRPDYIWTAVNVDGSLYFIQGIHYVNREYYLIASVPFKEGDKEEYCYHYEIEETGDD